MFGNTQNLGQNDEYFQDLLPTNYKQIFATYELAEYYELFKVSYVFNMVLWKSLNYFGMIFDRNIKFVFWNVWLSFH